MNCNLQGQLKESDSKRESIFFWVTPDNDILKKIPLQPHDLCDNSSSFYVQVNTLRLSTDAWTYSVLGQCKFYSIHVESLIITEIDIIFPRNVTVRHP